MIHVVSLLGLEGVSLDFVLASSVLLISASRSVKPLLLKQEWSLVLVHNVFYIAYKGAYGETEAVKNVSIGTKNIMLNS